MSEIPSTSFHIIEAETQHQADVVALVLSVLASGDTYVYSPNLSTVEVKAIWFAAPNKVYVALDAKGKLLGTYLLKANQPDLGKHVANASFMVSAEARGLGLGKALGQHALAQAKNLGFEAMQFNYVVASNQKAVALWQGLGFSIIGTVPKAFRHQTLGLTDVHVMHRFL
jgi:GNAT superfamily N-acetyltransferase